MKSAKTIIAAAALAAVFPVNAQVSANADRFSPLANGYIERGRTMSDAGNFAGVIDQLRHLDTQCIPLSPEQAEECTFLLAKAYYERNDSECLRLLLEFRDAYPASPLAQEAALAIGDFYFFRHEWPEALEAYSNIDLDRLNRDDKTLYTYREALAMLNTGHFEEARPLIESLANNPEYSNAYDFYTAYLDYIDGDYDSAYSLFSKVAPGTAGLDAGYYMTQIEYIRGEYETVINHGRSLLRTKTAPALTPEIYRIVGLSYFKTGNSKSAEGFLEEYLSTTPGTPEADAVYAMGAIDYEEGRYNAALSRLADVTDRNDAISQGAWLYIGQCLLQQDDDSSAALAFEKASRENFDKSVSETALYNYVTALTRGGKIPFSSSSDMLETFVKRYPDSEYTPEVEAYLATAYYNDRNYTKALIYIDGAHNPSARLLAIKQNILYELGIQELTNGETANAERHLSQCVALKKYGADIAAQASLWLGDAQFQLGDYRKAKVSYSQFINSDKSSENRALGYYDLAYTLYKLEDYKGAAKEFASAISAAPALPEQLLNDARIRRADCLYYTSDYSGAAALYTKAITDNATDADYALYRRGVLYGLSGDTKSKLADLTRVEREFPQSRWLSKVLLEEALTYEETGQAGLAADAYKKRLGISGDVDIDELLRMAAAMNEAERWSDLLDVVERIRHAGGLEADEVADISLYEADALSHLGRRQEAVEIYTQLARTPVSLPGSKAVVILAENEITEGRYEAARVRMEEFTDAGTPHQYWLARGFIALADAYHGLGRTSLAKEYLNSLRENYPGTEQDIRNMISTRLKKWK